MFNSDKMLTDTEKLMLSKVFEGNFPSFKVLGKQINGLYVKVRRKEYHTYYAFFDTDEKVSRLIGQEENIEVSGTLAYINESDVTLNVSVKVLDGIIQRLLIGGDYHSENDDFTVKKMVWREPQ